MAEKCGRLAQTNPTCGSGHSRYALRLITNLVLRGPAVEMTEGSDHGLRAISCWIAGLFLAFAGVALLVSRESWPNDRVAGGVIALAALLLLPPVLRRIRLRLTWTKSRWVPFVFGCLIIPIGFAIGAPFTPTGQARDQLREWAVVEARKALGAGDATAAQRVLRRFRSDHDQTVDRLLARADAAGPKTSRSPSPSASAPRIQPAVAENCQSPAAAYAERISTYWLPEAQSLPAVPSDTEDAVGVLLSKIDGLVVDIKDGDDLPLSPAQLTARGQLVATVSAKQRTLFPVMRKHYADGLGAKLFRRDIRVTASGPRSSVLRLTGGMFSLNANIEDMQKELEPVVRPLRFAKVEYRWSSYFDETVSYRLHPPADETVGQWTGDQFEKLGKIEAHAVKSNAVGGPRVHDPACVPALAAAAHLHC